MGDHHIDAYRGYICPITVCFSMKCGLFWTKNALFFKVILWIDFKRSEFFKYTSENLQYSRFIFSLSRGSYDFWCNFKKCLHFLYLYVLCLHTMVDRSFCVTFNSEQNILNYSSTSRRRCALVPRTLRFIVTLCRVCSDLSTVHPLGDRRTSKVSPDLSSKIFTLSMFSGYKAFWNVLSLARVTPLAF